jgi:dephospho-CoA kinase
MDALCDETWALTVPREKQVTRIVARDGLSPEDAAARIESQMPLEERNARATYVVNTDRPIERTQAELEQLYRAAQRREEKNG